MKLRKLAIIKINFEANELYMNSFKIAKIFLFILFFGANLQIFFGLTDKNLNVVGKTDLRLNVSQEEKTEQWLKNTDFDTSASWYTLEQGDASDLDEDISDNEANCRILGDKKTYSLATNINKSSDWANISNPAFPVKPDRYIVNNQGFRVQHTWDENVNQTRNAPSARILRKITMPVNMSDYIITSASFRATFNASVNNDVDTPLDGLTYFAIGDFVKFYVLITDKNNEQSYEISKNQTKYLGQNSPPILSYSDINMVIIPEDILKAYLTSVLQKDYYNFSLILGMDIYCEDNIAANDIDIFNYLIIKSINLTFTYEKKIDQSSLASWNQKADKITGDYLEILNAILKFKYKTSETWITVSPNSEIKILINNNEFAETIKLSSSKTYFADAKKGGFDITSLIKKDEGILLSIQIFMADGFGLDHVIVISIDEVYLEITYVINEPIEDYSWLIITLSSVIIALATVFTLYQVHFKYPPLVRKTRKLRKKIKKGRKVKKSIIVNNREDVIKNYLQNTIKILEFPQEQPVNVDKVSEISKTGETIQIKKEGR